MGPRHHWAGLLVGLCVATTAHCAPFSAAWTQRTATPTPAGAPGARAWVDMLYDPVAQRTVLFAGSASQYMNDIAYLDLSQNKWTEKEPFIIPNAIFPPCGRDEYAFEYDAYNRLYWSFGGSGYACSQRTSSAQSGTTTTVIVDTTLPSTVNNFYRDFLVSVSGSISYTAFVQSYDAATKKLTLYTAIPTLAPGTTYKIQPQPGGGTWSYDPATRAWRGFSAPSFGYTGARPISRLSPAMAYSTADNAMVMFGGVTYNDTWALDAETQTWAQLLRDGLSTSPPPRAQVTNSMVYDSVNDVFILFGGRCGDGTSTRCINGKSLNDTWVYKLSTNTWTKMTPAQSPPVRQQHQMAFDPVNGVVVLFGGHNAPTFYNDIWVYDYAANTWTQVPTPAVTPAARYIGALTYDAGHDLFVLYGGCLSSGATTGQLWTLKLTNLGGPNQDPVARITVNPTSGTTLTSFAFSGATSTDDGTIVSYAWNFGDSTTGSGVSVNKTYASPGTYTVTLTVTDNQGATDSATVQVDVAPPPAASVTFTGTTLSGTVQNGTVTQIKVNGTPVSFTTAGSTWSVNVPIGGPGTLSIAVTVSGPGGGTTKTVTVTVP